MRTPPLPPNRLGWIFRQWFPLALSFELMMLEGPFVQGSIGRLPHAQLNLAAFGLTMSLSLLLESPIIMLLATSIALVKDRDSYRALRWFTVWVSGVCTVVTALVAFTPLFDFVAIRVMGQPVDIVNAARLPLRVMLLWTAAIGWRRFYQGILVRYDMTRLVTAGTAIRFLAAGVTVVTLTLRGHTDGAVVAACGLMAAVLTEAVATTLFALPLLRSEFHLHKPLTEAPLTQSAIWRFHGPLALTMLLTLLVQPLTASALGRLPNERLTLAAWPVAFMLLLVIRGPAFSLQEITVAKVREPNLAGVLRVFSWRVGLVSVLVTLAVVVTPLHSLYLTYIVGAPRPTWPYVLAGIWPALPLPLLSALGSWVRGRLLAAHRSREITRGMFINLLTHAVLLTVGVAIRLPGMLVAAASVTLATAVEFVWLLRAAGPEEHPTIAETD